MANIDSDDKGGELSVEQAADILNVSQSYLMDLLDQGEIPCRDVGGEHRIILGDLLDYKKQMDEKREAVLTELVAFSQQEEMGY